jgi:hypothetical protein
MFIVHVKGATPLQYSQACQSVIVALEPRFIQHYYHLLEPAGFTQNYVQVKRDLSDLVEKIEELIHDLPLADHIAANNAQAFRERYLTLAAKACYWRALFDGYSTVFYGLDIDGVANKYGKQSYGLPFESFAYLDSQSMLDFSVR